MPVSLKKMKDFAATQAEIDNLDFTDADLYLKKLFDKTEYASQLNLVYEKKLVADEIL